MKLAVFGVTGTVGQALLQEALAANHTVTALARSPEKIAAFSDRVSIIVGDYFDADARAQALNGAEAVLSTIGPPLKRAPNNGEYAKAMTELVAQMQSAGVKRIVAVGGAGLRLGNEKLGVPRRVMRLMLRLMGGNGLGQRTGAQRSMRFSTRLDNPSSATGRNRLREFCDVSSGSCRIQSGSSSVGELHGRNSE